MVSRGPGRVTTEQVDIVRRYPGKLAVSRRCVVDVGVRTLDPWTLDLDPGNVTRVMLPGSRVQGNVTWRLDLDPGNVTRVMLPVSRVQVV